MIWTENAFLYVFDRMCKKYKPRDCDKCPLGKWKNGCQVGIMINIIKDWAKDNIDSRILEVKNGR